MPRFTRLLRGPMRLILSSGFAALFGASFPLHAQEPPAHRQATIIPPGGVLSVRTDMIRSQAQYMQAAGDFMVSASIARRHHALAAQQEIRNHAEWVKTYFELKDLNKAYYLREHPPYIDQVDKRKNQLERAIVDNPQLTLEGDVKETKLNWLLDRLATTALAAEALADMNQRPSLVDQNLLPDERRHIMLTDGAHAGGEKLLFRANEGEILVPRWSFALRGPEFDQTRTGFERVREQAEEEVKTNGSMSYATQLALKRAVDDIMTAFEQHNNRQRRFASSEDYRTYQRGKQFLQSLALSVHRVIETRDQNAFDGSYRFEGQTVTALIRHMCRHGLEFGPPTPGDEAVYRKLFLALREMYVEAREANPVADQRLRR